MISIPKNISVEQAKMELKVVCDYLEVPNASLSERGWTYQDIHEWFKIIQQELKEKNTHTDKKQRKPE